METMGRIAAIKTFFERADTFAPQGGRKVEMAELKSLSNDDRNELALLCAEKLGVTIQAS